MAARGTGGTLLVPAGLVLGSVLVLVSVVTGAAVTPEEDMAAEVPVCESATAHSHATCEAEFQHLVDRFNMLETPVNVHCDGLS